MTKDENEQQGFGNSGFWRSSFGHQFGRQQFGQRGWIRPAVLKLLEKKPMNGMEMINRFYEVSHGWWRPSPGSVYPLLETLETEGLIKKRSDGRYEVTKKFTERSAPTGQIEDMMANMESTVSYFEDMSKSDKAKFSAYKPRIEKLIARLSKLK